MVLRGLAVTGLDRSSGGASLDAPSAAYPRENNETRLLDGVLLAVPQ